MDASCIACGKTVRPIVDQVLREDIDAAASNILTFKPENWCIYQCAIRTNNDVEG